MQKIISLFKRDYRGNRQVYDEVVPGAEWVLVGEGVPTIKWDGTCCMVRGGRLFKRYDRKLTKAANKRKRRGHKGPWALEDFKPAPDGWEAAEAEANRHTGHWPGWVPVSDGPQDQWHREALEWFSRNPQVDQLDGTYELVGPKIQGNPHGLKPQGDPHTLSGHQLWAHGERFSIGTPEPPRDFRGLHKWLGDMLCEGIVWHHPDGRMVKIKRKDFGHPWPPDGSEFIK